MGRGSGRGLDCRRPGVNAAVRRLGDAIEAREARLSIGFVVAAIVIFVIALVLVPPSGVTYDEARYLGIGYSMVEGLGPQTVFGGYFLPHAPVWPTLVVAPAVVLGIDPLSVGRALNALSAVGLILLGAAMAWRIRPAAAALTAIGLLATTYLHELTRTSRLDVPSAMLAVAYLALALVAVRRGSTRLSVAAGLLFGVAFLVKEIALPLAPVPILAAILHRQPWRPILRTAGWLTLSAALAVAPWFMFVAQVSHRVYRLGTPDWTLLPIGLALVGVGVAGVVAGRLDVPAIGDRLAARLEGRARTWLVAAITVVWMLGLTLVFTGTLEARGTELIDLRQIAAYLREWYPLLLTSAAGAVGLVLSIIGRRDPELGRREAIEDLWLATFCGLPLIILVMGVGEAPRNYLAQLAIGAGIAAAGWLWLFETTLRRWPAITLLGVGAIFGATLGVVFGELFGLRIRAGAVGGLAVGLAVAAAVAWILRFGRGRPEIDRPAMQVAVASLLVTSLISASAALAYAVDLRRPSAARDVAVDTVAAWARDHVDPGSTIAFGSYLGFEMALPLRNQFKVRQARHVLVVGDREAPDGVTMFGRPATDDWISVDIAPKNVNEYQAFSASMLTSQLRRSGAAYWVYSTGTTTSAPTIIPALQDATGFEAVAHWAFARPRGGPIDTYVYRLDLDRIALDTGRIHVAPDALERMVRFVESEAATDLARRLVSQVVPTPGTAATDALVERLRQLADGSG